MWNNMIMGMHNNGNERNELQLLKKKENYILKWFTSKMIKTVSEYLTVT